MNQIIKDRIEKINSGIVPEGYKKTPFGIFPCDWSSEIKLKDFCRINPKSEKLNDKFAYIDLESVVDGKIISKKVIEKENAPSRAQRVLQEGDVLYQVVRPYQRNNYLFLCYDDGLQTVASTGYAQLRNDNPIFLFQVVNSDYFCLQVLEKCTGTNYPAINSEDLGEVSIIVPHLKQEQSKIAEILMKWDEEIELYEKLIEKLKQYKSVCLQKMFPAKGKNAPEWRFKGFTGDWEQRKLGDVAVSFEYGLNAAAKTFDGVNKYLRITDIDDSSHTFKDDDLTSPETDLSVADNYLLHYGDVLFARTGASVGKTYIYKESDGSVYFAGFLIRARIKPTFDSEFVFQNTLTTQYNQYIKITSQRSGQPGLNAQEYAEYSFFAPNYSEQMKIGVFLRSIDSLMTLHQRKVEIIKKQRKALQQYLLTGIVRVRV